MKPSVHVHELAVVEEGSEIGDDTTIGQFAHVHKTARIGASCHVGAGVQVDRDVSIGNYVSIERNAVLLKGLILENGVFVGPHVCFANRKLPRAVTPQMDRVNAPEVDFQETKVEAGVTIGANATILGGITLGRWSMVGAGAVVTGNVPPYALVYGNPARLHGVVAPSGDVVSNVYEAGTYSTADGQTQVVIEPEWIPEWVLNS